MKSGESGFVLTNNRRLAETADLFSDKCYRRFPTAPKTPAFPALNVRLSDMRTVLALVQLKLLPNERSGTRVPIDAARNRMLARN